MVLPSMRLDGKVALVTGAGSGIGKALAVAVSEAGADCIPTELPDRLGELDPVCAEIRANGRRACPLPLALPGFVTAGILSFAHLHAEGYIQNLRATPGVEMKMPMRYTANSDTVNRIRFLNSGILWMFQNPEATLEASWRRVPEGVYTLPGREKRPRNR